MKGLYLDMQYFINDFLQILHQVGILAQPFRAIAHNGEINTLKGNCNWMKVHEQEMNSPLYLMNMENLRPVIPAGSSDSAALDSVFELLNISGQPAPLAKLMLIPDAWSKKSKTLSKRSSTVISIF